jgi:hypothetical protein
VPVIDPRFLFTPQNPRDLLGDPHRARRWMAE